MNGPERRIGDYGLIGDGRSAALVGLDGSIDWLCWPRMDAEACFAALLGSGENGRWRIAPADPAAQVTRAYLGDTLILSTRFRTGAGVAEVVDFMAAGRSASEIVRLVRGIEGEVEMRSRLRLSFDYGRRRPAWRQAGEGECRAIAGAHGVRLATNGPVSCGREGCAADFRLAAGQTREFLLAYHPSRDPAPPVTGGAGALDETKAFWESWVGRCGYRGRWRDAVIRSLIVLKALVYEPSGAVAAAPTSSLPERIGGARNWDYRFCWLRDATFTLLAFLHAGYREEASAWRDWLLRAVAGEPGDIQPVYGLEGATRLVEWEADWLPGFAGSRPVRFGNAAFQQRQLDVVGEVVDALHQARLHGLPPSAEVWRMQVDMVDHLASAWTLPDRGIWESRQAPKRFTQSQAMVWAAVDRSIRAAQALGLDAPLPAWRRLRAEIHAEVCRRGFDAGRNSFVRDFGSTELDASLLLLPQIGFLPPTDPRIRGTVEAIGRELGRDGFIRRYDTQVTDDGLGGGEAAFLACTFWYADALLLLGRRAEAEAAFERVLGIRNDLGLLSEEYDPVGGRLLGNFPQALSHLALVNTALNLTRDQGPATRRGAVDTDA